MLWERGWNAIKGRSWKNWEMSIVTENGTPKWNTGNVLGMGQKKSIIICPFSSFSFNFFLVHCRVWEEESLAIGVIFVYHLPDLRIYTLYTLYIPRTFKNRDLPVSFWKKKSRAVLEKNNEVTMKE